MVDFWAERVAFTTSTTGTGAIAVGPRLGTDFRVPSETSMPNGATVRYLMQESGITAIIKGTYDSSGGGSFSRDSIVCSVISGTWGTTNPTLASGAAEVRLLPPGPEEIAYFALLNVAQTFTAKQIFQNTVKLQQTLEKWNIVADNLASGDNNFDILTAAIWNWSAAGDTNATLNFRGDGSNSLDSLMAVGESITVAAVVVHTGTAYLINALKIDGTSVTPKWVDGTAPSAGSTNATDVYTYAILKTASATFTVFAQRVKWDEA